MNEIDKNYNKTFEEGQLICSEIQKLATKIDKLNKDIKLCDFFENKTLRMKDSIKGRSQEENNNIKVKSRDRIKLINTLQMECLFV